MNSCRVLGTDRSSTPVSKRFRRGPKSSSCSNTCTLSLASAGIVQTLSEQVLTRLIGSIRYDRHIEGKELFPNLQHLDPELFSDMPHLTFLHLAVHDKLRALPPLSGVPNLRSAVFAHMFSLERVPSLERVRSLQRLELPYLPVLQAIPDLTPLRHLVHFVVYRRSNLCCNGFMGKCDLDNAACTANTALGIPAAICMEGPNAPRATAGTLATVQAFSFAVCQDSPFDQANSTDALSFDTTAPCGGVPFRQCELPVNFESSGVGICYNNRMQVLSCVTNPDIIRLRQAQIAGAVGLPCNITEEAWFGCR